MVWIFKANIDFYIRDLNQKELGAMGLKIFKKVTPDVLQMGHAMEFNSRLGISMRINGQQPAQQDNSGC